MVPGFDPQAQPLVSQSQSLLPLHNETLQLDFIQEAFRHRIDWHVEPVFTDSFRAEACKLQNIIQAAVFFPLVPRPDGMYVLLTRRATHLSNHAGQISFPGGRIERSDSGAIAAALRETREEIGVGAEYIRLLGTHPGFLTTTRFIMKPVIGYIRPGFSIHAEPTEVAEVFEVPLSFLLDPAHHNLHRAQLPEGGHRLYFSIPWGSYFIWGATAALIRNLYHHLAAAQIKLGVERSTPQA